MYFSIRHFISNQIEGYQNFVDEKLRTFFKLSACNRPIAQNKPLIYYLPYNFQHLSQTHPAAQDNNLPVEPAYYCSGTIVLAKIITR